MQVLPPYGPLPAGHYRVIGEIIVQWTVIEAMFDEALYAALGVSTKMGRIGAIDLSASTCPARIKELFQARGLKPIALPKGFARDVELAANNRNCLAHGLWARLPSTNTPVLQGIGDVWRPIKGEPEVSRRVKPQGMPLTESDLREVLAFIQTIGDRATVYRKAVEAALATSPRRLPAPATRRSRRARA